MFVLNVHSMDGSCRRLEVGADVNIPDIRAQLAPEHLLPPFYGIRLFQGGRELKGSSDAVEVELQAVVSVEPSKLFADLESFLDMATRLPTSRTQQRAFEETRKQGVAGALAAAEALHSMPEGCFEADHCEQLLSILRKSFHAWTTRTSDLSSMPMGSALGAAVMSAAWAHCCSDPTLYIRTLLEGLSAVGPGDIGWEMGPLAEIAVRSRSQLAEHSEDLVRHAVHSLHSLSTYRRSPQVVSVHGAFRLLGQFGNMSHETHLERAIEALSHMLGEFFPLDHLQGEGGEEQQQEDDGGVESDEEVNHSDEDGYDDEDYDHPKGFALKPLLWDVIYRYCGREFYDMLLDEARQALALIRDRDQSQNGLRAADIERAEEAVEINSMAENAIDEGPLVPQHAPSSETEVARDELVEAKHRSVQDALEQEQAQISEAILRSKMDEHSADSIIRTRLTFHSPAVFDHLLASEDLKACVARVENAGCQVRPPWANGALVLVPLMESQLAEECLQLKAHNIILFESDLACVDAALRELPRRRRPLLKTEQFADCRAGIALVSDGQSDDDDGWSCGAAIGASEVGDSGPQVQLVVERTFWNLVPRQDVSEASVIVQSAPAGPGDSMLQNPRRWQASCLED